MEEGVNCHSCCSPSVAPKAPHPKLLQRAEEHLGANVVVEVNSEAQGEQLPTLWVKGLQALMPPMVSIQFSIF